MGYISDVGLNVQADALATLLNNGYLRIYAGTQPENANTPIGSQTLLAELRFGSPAFGPAVAGCVTATALTPDHAPNTTGIATWFRCLKADGMTGIYDGSIGCDLNFDSTTITAGRRVSIGSFSFIIPHAIKD